MIEPAAMLHELLEDRRSGVSAAVMSARFTPGLPAALPGLRKPCERALC